MTGLLDVFVPLALGLGAVGGALLLPEVLAGASRLLHRAELRARVVAPRTGQPTVGHVLLPGVQTTKPLQGRKPGEFVLALLRTLSADVLRNGIPGLRVVSRQLLRLPALQKSLRELLLVAQAGGRHASEETVCEALLAVALASGVLGVVLSGQFVVGLCLAGASVWLISTQAGKRLARREEQLREQIPDALRMIGLCFAAGYSLQQAFEQAADDTPEPLQSELAQTSFDLQAGRSSEEGLDALKRRTQAADLEFVTVALEVQHKTGGSMQEILENAAASIVAGFELRRSLAVQTAQARM